MDVLVISGIIVGALLCLGMYARRWQRPAHWAAYLAATPGDRNVVQWHGPPPALATTAAAFVDMYQSTWPLVRAVWPRASTRLAEVGRPRAFSECEAALAPITGNVPAVDRFVAAYTLMAMVTYDSRLAAALVAADMTGSDLNEAAASYILGLYETVEPISSSAVGDLVAERWKKSPFRASHNL